MAVSFRSKVALSLWSSCKTPRKVLYQHLAALLCLKGGGYPPVLSQRVTHAQIIKDVISETSAPMYVQTLQQRADVSLHACTLLHWSSAQRDAQHYSPFCRETRNAHGA